jgi:hypothetical protein
MSILPTIAFAKIPTEKEIKKAVPAMANATYYEGGHSKTNQAAVVWCILNRYDYAKGKHSLYRIVTAPHQFAYHKHPRKAYYKRKKYYEAFVTDIINRWIAEKNGPDAKTVGRVLPKQYRYFAGNGTWNRFRVYYKYRKGQHYLTPKKSDVYEK